MPPDVSKIGLRLAYRVRPNYREAVIKKIADRISKKAKARYKKAMITTSDSNHTLKEATTYLLNALR